MCLSGLVRQSANVIPDFSDIEGEHYELEPAVLGSKINEDTFDYGAFYAEGLRQLADNVVIVRKNPSQLREFLDFYCLPDPDQHMQDVISFYEEQQV